MMAGLVPALEEGFAGTWEAMMLPPPILTISEWADQYRVLAGKAASEPGPWRTSRTPYLKAIMDKLSPRDPTQIVVVQKGSQVGMTEAGNNWIGYLIDRAPGPILAVTPTDVLAKRASKQRIMPLIEETARLAAKVKPARARDSGNTVLMKDFPGGVLVLTGANSAVGLRSMPARYLFLDEVDAYPQAVGGEGNPLDLAERAARTFGRRRKIFVVSTPLRKMVSHITAALNDCEQVFDYHVPCPSCGHCQPLVWEQMRWTVPAGFSFAEDQHGRLRSIPGVTYECRECHGAIEEHHKTAMLTWGSWVARWDRGTHSAGFFLNALYSPVGWFSWGEAAAMFERARKDVTKEQVFVNTILGLGYEEPSEAPDWEFLFGRRETYPRGVVPAGVRFLTAGVDHQEDRVEITVVGWGREKRSWVIDHLVIPCSSKLAERTQVLDELVGTDWPCAGGGQVPLWCIAVDSGSVHPRRLRLGAATPAARPGPAGGVEWHRDPAGADRHGLQGHGPLGDGADPAAESLGGRTQAWPPRRRPRDVGHEARVLPLAPAAAADGRGTRRRRRGAVRLLSFPVARRGVFPAADGGTARQDADEAGLRQGAVGEDPGPQRGTRLLDPGAWRRDRERARPHARLGLDAHRGRPAGGAARGAPPRRRRCLSSVRAARPRARWSRRRRRNRRRRPAARRGAG